jgi:hypothetical protein
MIGGGVEVAQPPTDPVETHILFGARLASFANPRYANAVLIKLLDAIKVAKKTLIGLAWDSFITTPHDSQRP